MSERTLSNPSTASRFLRARGKRYASGVLSGYALRGATVAIGFLMTPFLLHQLGRESYGALALATSMAGWLGLLDIGLAPGLNVHLARLSGRLDVVRLNRLASSAQGGQLVCTALVLMGGAGLAVGLPALAGESYQNARDLILLALGLAAGAAVSAASYVYSAALVAHQFVWAENVVRGVRALSRAAITVGLVFAGFGLPAVGAAHLLAALISAAASRRACRRLLPEMRIELRRARKDDIRMLSGSGIWLSLGALAGVLIAGLDRAVAARLLSLETVATLAVSSATFVLAESLLTQSIDAARPALAQARGQGELQEAVLLYRGMLSSGTALALVGGAALVAVNRTFVSAWTGPESHGGIGLDLALAAHLVTHVWILPNRAVLTASLRVRRQTLVRLLEGALNFVLSVALAYRFGLTGVLAATALAALATSGWALPRLAIKELGPEARLAMVRALVRNAALAVGLAPAALLARIVAEEIGGYAGVLAGVACVVACGAPLAWLLCIDPPLKNRARSLLRNLSVSPQPA